MIDTVMYHVCDVFFNFEVEKGYSPIKFIRYVKDN